MAPRTTSPHLAVYCVTIALAHLRQRKLRLATAIAGVAVALLLLLIQLAFLDAMRSKVTALYDLFDFDIAIVPATYQFLYSAGTMDRVRLSQARATGGVAGTFAINLTSTHWTVPPSEKKSTLLVIGVDDDPGFIRDRDLLRNLRNLQSRGLVLADRYSSDDIGALQPGQAGNIRDQRVVIGGSFALGLFFYADGSVMIRNGDAPGLIGRRLSEVSLGLVRVSPGADPAAVKARLLRALPDDVQVFLRGELEQRERDFFTVTKPIGIMLQSGMVIGFLVGAVILFQIVAADIANRAKELAVLKAMGFAPSFLYGVGAAQAMILALGGLAISLAAGGLLLAFVDMRTHLPTSLSPFLLMVTAAAALGMSAVAGLSTLRPVMRADPAALF